jgi:hypothetical protein
LAFAVKSENKVDEITSNPMGNFAKVGLRLEKRRENDNGKE